MNEINTKFQDAKFEEIYARIIAENKFKSTIPALDFDHARITAQDAIQRKGIEIERLQAELNAANAKIEEINNIVWGAKTLVEYSHKEAIEDIAKLLSNKELK